MMNLTWLGSLAVIATLALSVNAQDSADEPGSRKPPDVPGITSANPFSQGCVDCHVKRPDMDVRLSTILREWSSRGVQAERLERMKKFASGHELAGRHPPVSLEDSLVPDTCMNCHAADAGIAPALGPLLHGIHLTGAEQNHTSPNSGGNVLFAMVSMPIQEPFRFQAG
ncbi:hypothetical protein F6455_01205 [Proteobacteria bacterium 005FR1]|nr:hypothetical protein [Proteobacteria bacterium 005FR1]